MHKSIIFRNIKWNMSNTTSHYNSTSHYKIHALNLVQTLVSSFKYLIISCYINFQIINTTFRRKNSSIDFLQKIKKSITNSIITFQVFQTSISDIFSIHQNSFGLLCAFYT